MSLAGPLGVALVSGGSGDIGAAICRALHADGWGVVVGYVSQDRAEALAGELATDDVPAKAMALDLTDPDQIRASVGDLLVAEGRVGALVLNAGWSESALFVETNEDHWRTTLQINLMGPMLVTRLCLPGMVEAGEGAIVGITSEAAKTGDAANAVYSAGKAGLAALLRTIVREHGRDGIRANCVAPGPIDTRLLRAAFPDQETADATIEKLVRLVPMRRLGQPEDVAAAVRYLVTEGAHVAGEHLSVGGGVVM